MKKYPVYCAWCEKKGIETVVSWSAAKGSSGICTACAEKVKIEMAIFRAAEGEYNGNYKMRES